MKKKKKIASLFAGIGGICYGFVQNNCEIIWANEIDRDACKTYRQNFGGDYLVEGDITKIDAKDIPDIDILNAGFPCQAFSVAGYQKGFNDTRGTMFFEIERILKEKKPEAILLENVKNLQVHDKGKTFTIIIDALERIGYHVKAQVLDSMEYGNIPQTRKRIYIVGFLSKQAHDRFVFPEKQKLTKKISNIVDTGKKVDSKYYYNNFIHYDLIKDVVVKKDTLYQWRRVYCRENKSHVCPTLTANMGTGGHNVPLLKDDYGIRKLTPEECIKFQGFPKEFKFPKDISNAAKYKQAGNSVTVPVINRIVKNMLDAMK